MAYNHVFKIFCVNFNWGQKLIDYFGPFGQWGTYFYAHPIEI